MASHDSCVAPDSSLVGWWRLNETSGTTATDTTGVNDDGTATNTSGGTTEWVAGEVENAFDFDGVNDYVDVGNDGTLQLSTGTLEFWFQAPWRGTDTAGNSDGSYRGLVCKPNAWCIWLTNDNQMYIWRNYNYASNNANGLVYWSAAFGSSAIFNPPTWNHFAMTFENGVTDGLIIYLNGVLIEKDTLTILNQSSNIVFGTVDSTSTSTAAYFNGLIDEVSIYNTVLTSTQIADIYNAGTAIPPSGKCECGDGDVASVEGCDDENTIDDDGCSATCTVEDGWGCSGEPSVCGKTCSSPSDCAGYACNAGTSVCETTCSADGQCDSPSYVCDTGTSACVTCTPATETCDGKDNDCDGTADEDYATTSTTCGVGACAATGSKTCIDGVEGDSCKAGTASTETCDGKDNDCDGSTDEGLDVATTCGVGACAATGSKTCVGGVEGDSCKAGTAATETCNSVDDDCDGSVDENDATDVKTWYADNDADGYGDKSNTKTACSQPTGYYVTDNTDCDDANTHTHPKGTEICDGTDNDCDGTVDESDALNAPAWYRDSDGDRYGDNAVSQVTCTQPSGYRSDNTDCDDADSAKNPGATETCDGKDNDCDGTIDEGVKRTYYKDADSDGYGDLKTTEQACSPSSGFVTLIGGSDCNDGDAGIHPGATETCNGIDDDCNGVTDNGLTFTTYYADSDSDTYGNSKHPSSACSQPTGYVSDSTDCNDGDTASHPGATETCDTKDNDCDGSTDEGLTNTWYADADGDNIGDSANSYVGCPRETYVTTKGDNCPTVANADQKNTDVAIAGGDSKGDACDADDDADGVGDKIDPQILTANLWYWVDASSPFAVSISGLGSSYKFVSGSGAGGKISVPGIIDRTKAQPKILKNCPGSTGSPGVCIAY